jgi:tetratricopeptide (TPR) repeat protein
MIWAASGARDHKLVLATVDERLATGRVSGADLTRKLRLKATTHYALRDYRAAAAAFDKLAAQGGLTADDLTLQATSQMQLRDYGRATTTLERAIAANDKAGRSGKNAALLEMLNSAYFETKNDAKRMQTLHRLMAVAPKQSTFKQLASAYEVESARDPVVMINVYRLGASKGLLAGEQYSKYAETALDLSSPGEAVAMLEKGMAAGAIKKDDRNNKVLADAKSQVDRVKATLPQQEAEAKAIQTGEPEAKLATAYFTLKNYAKATEAAQRAVTKGNLKRPDDVNMLLGISLANSKKPVEAKKAFTAAAAANAKTRGVANLWTSVTG